VFHPCIAWHLVWAVPAAEMSCSLSNFRNVKCHTMQVFGCEVFQQRLQQPKTCQVPYDVGVWVYLNMEMFHQRLEQSQTCQMSCHAGFWVCCTWRYFISAWNRSTEQMSSPQPPPCPSTSTSQTKLCCTSRTRKSSSQPCHQTWMHTRPSQCAGDRRESDDCSNTTHR